MMGCLCKVSSQPAESEASRVAATYTFMPDQKASEDLWSHV